MLGADARRRGGQRARRRSCSKRLASALGASPRIPAGIIGRDGDHQPAAAFARAVSPRRATAAAQVPARCSGTARLGQRTKDLVKRLGPSDVAVIDHRNLDRIAAEELVGAGVRRGRQRLAVLGRQLPERGPADPVRAGVRCRRVGAPTLRAALRRRPDRCSTGPRSARRRSVVAEGRLLEADELARDLDAAAAADRPGARTTSPRTRCPTSARRASCSPGRSTSPRRGPSSATATA